MYYSCYRDYRINLSGAFDWWIIKLETFDGWQILIYYQHFVIRQLYAFSLSHIIILFDWLSVEYWTGTRNLYVTSEKLSGLFISFYSYSLFVSSQPSSKRNSSEMNVYYYYYAFWNFIESAESILCGKFNPSCQLYHFVIDCIYKDFSHKTEQVARISRLLRWIMYFLFHF